MKLQLFGPTRQDDDQMAYHFNVQHGPCLRSSSRRPPRGVFHDTDSSVSPTRGEQKMSVWNGRYECTCYHPLFVFNQFGDPERCVLPPGKLHSADGWENALKPVVSRFRGKVARVYFRADAGFANPEVHE